MIFDKLLAIAEVTFIEQNKPDKRKNVNLTIQSSINHKYSIYFGWGNSHSESKLFTVLSFICFKRFSE